MTPTHSEFSELLNQSVLDDQSAVDRLMPLIYRELHSVAHRAIRFRSHQQSLNTTSLLHETYVRLSGKELSLNDRGHFVAIASRTMRRVLIDEARARNAEKRGGGQEIIPLDENDQGIAPDDRLLRLNEALERLEALDERKGRIIELHYFGGLSQEETATHLGLSLSTVVRELRLARAWLANEIRPQA